MKSIIWILPTSGNSLASQLVCGLKGDEWKLLIACIQIGGNKECIWLIERNPKELGVSRGF